jgi:hypothetical protein
MLSDPRAHPWHFVGLELVFLACFLLTVRDVAARWRRGERYALFQWLVILAYGVTMELVAFAAYPDYEHGRFTVQLVGGKLPLYVTFVYVVFHYTGLKLVERRGLRPLPEAVTAGLAILLIDVPFDVVGVDAGWWVWHPSSHDVAQRWLGVPVTSYEWYLLFGAVLVGACRLLRPRVEGRSLLAYVGLAPLVALGVIVIGVIAFLPFHALEALGVPDGAIVAAHAAVCAVVALRARGRADTAPPGLSAITAVLAAWHVAVLSTLWQRGVVRDAPAKAALIAAAVVSLLFLFVRTAPSPITDRSASRPPRPAPAGSRTSS